MKKLLFIFAISLLGSSCQKSDDITPNNSAERVGNNGGSTIQVPSTFTKKVMLEMYSSSICATCVDAMRMYEVYAAQYPGRVFGADLHDADPMKISQWNTMDSVLNITQYSSGSFNRLAYNGNPVIHKTAWNSSGMMAATLNQTATCGLKISSTVSNSTVNVVVSAGFAASLTGQYRITVYLLEDSVTGTSSGYNQANYYNTTASSPFYGLGNPIIGYKHNCVIRRVLTANRGNVISTNNMIAPNSLITQNFSASLTGMNSTNMYVLAFIHKSGSSPTTQDVLNVQRAKLGMTKNWD